MQLAYRHFLQSTVRVWIYMAHVFNHTNIVEIFRTIEAQCASVRNYLGNFEPDQRIFSFDLTGRSDKVKSQGHHKRTRRWR